MPPVTGSTGQPAASGGVPGGDSSGPRELLAPVLPGGEPVEGLLRAAQFFTLGTASDTARSTETAGGARSSSRGNGGATTRIALAAWALTFAAMLAHLARHLWQPPARPPEPLA